MMTKIIDNDWDCVYKKNPAFYIVNDANQLFELAKKANYNSNEQMECLFTRAAVLLYPVALEALINVVYEYYEVLSTNELKNIPVKKKWLEASIKCLPQVGTLEREGKIIYKNGDKIETFNENSILFKQYIELKDIRNDIVHLKPDFVHIKSENIEDYDNNYPLYHLSKIPKDISSWRVIHAETAKLIYKNMINQSNEYMKGEIDWLISHPAFIEKINKPIT